MFIQKFMTIVEVCIASALIAGLFIWLPSTATIDLTIALYLLDMSYWVNTWFVSVVFVLMSDPGRVVGLDRWAVPWIQRKLGKTWYGTPRARYGGE